MKPLKARLTTVSKQLNAPLFIIEKDYLLGHILASISKEPTLANTLVFKGGTALKKVFFGNYRFSEDLDFSTINAPQNNKLRELLYNITKNTQQHLMSYGPFNLELKPKPENAPHPFGQEAFIISAQFPWHRTPQCHIKLEFTHDEPVLLAPNLRPIIHAYEENMDVKILCYSIEEIIAEKMRTLLQTHQNLINRGWNRPRARDYYDLWHVLNKYQNEINISELCRVLKPKCNHRKTSYEHIDDFFTETLIAEARQHWQSNLGNFVTDLPPCDEVLNETKATLHKLLSL